MRNDRFAIALFSLCLLPDRNRIVTNAERFNGWLAGAIRIYTTIYYALRTITGRYDMTRALFLRHGINTTITRVPLFPPPIINVFVFN